VILEFFFVESQLSCLFHPPFTPPLSAVQQRCSSFLCPPSSDYSTNITSFCCLSSSLLPPDGHGLRGKSLSGSPRPVFLGGVLVSSSGARSPVSITAFPPSDSSRSGSACLMGTYSDPTLFSPWVFFSRGDLLVPFIRSVLYSCPDFRQVSLVTSLALDGLPF